MSDISELERRISAALERIGAGAEALAAARAKAAEEAAATQPAQEDPQLAEMRDALEAEKTANAQLEERVKAIRDKQESQVAHLEERVARLTARSAEVEAEVERLRRVNTKLRESNKALREANAEGLGDAHLINTAMQTELDALRVQREADRSELDQIIGELAPLTGEDTHA
ncbi:MAG: hypothetical protein WCD16_01595 [Paracoccaceae bacterium]